MIDGSLRFNLSTQQTNFRWIVPLGDEHDCGSERFKCLNPRIYHLYYIHLMILEHGKTKHFLYLP